MTSHREERLARYREKRDFSRTEEPRGAGVTGREAAEQVGNRFVVQLHRARRRHYDLRLEIDDVLVSWAVPKGPTRDPESRRLAVRVEDHPLEYVEFEGIIPPGEYGGGDVIVWDRGRWAPVETERPAEAIDRGNLHFDLFGAKLVGRFVLIRRGEDDSGKARWLLLHKRDEHAIPGWDPEDHPRSVLSGKTNEEVAGVPEAMWRCDLPPDRAEVALSDQRSATPDADENPDEDEPTGTVSSATAEELAALDALGANGSWHVGGRELALTNLNKILFPATDTEPPVTKRDLIRYYVQLAPVILPYLVERPLNTQRFPNGVTEAGFWHKEVPGHAPDWLRRWRDPDAGEDTVRAYVIADSVAALAWLANYGAVELHPWTSRIGEIHRPSWALFDIDPGSATTFDDVLTLARLHRRAFEHLGLRAKPKVSGQRGVQVWIPIAARYSYDQTRKWVATVSRAIGDAVPELVSWAWRKEQREGRARLDYTQNVLNKTLVAPYSVRPRPGAPVSVPIEWDELDDPALTADRWTLRTLGDRLATEGDPFAELLGVEQDLPAL